MVDIFDPLGVVAAVRRDIGRVVGALRLPKRTARRNVEQAEIARVLGVESKGIDPLTEMPMYHDPVTEDTFIGNDYDEARRRLIEIRIGFGHPAPVIPEKLRRV
ncbi:hypothetical protein LCGC14_0554950 [marine sediment metagenome]|uniref:Uncharacterized protein n=1 Tax=marine sediment metagenome TaxID=412755 RepID=A0A0F9RNL4_9ZZZZ